MERIPGTLKKQLKRVFEGPYKNVKGKKREIIARVIVEHYQAQTPELKKKLERPAEMQLWFIHRFEDIRKATGNFNLSLLDDLAANILWRFEISSKKLFDAFPGLNIFLGNVDKQNKQIFDKIRLTVRYMGPSEDKKQHWFSILLKIANIIIGKIEFYVTDKVELQRIEIREEYQRMGHALTLLCGFAVFLRRREFGKPVLVHFDESGRELFAKLSASKPEDVKESYTYDEFMALMKNILTRRDIKFNL